MNNALCRLPQQISTHTLRGERDILSRGTVKNLKISTHTLRGERDCDFSYNVKNADNFNSHAPWGA